MSSSNIKTFLDFVEIQTKLATIFPLLIALAYVFYSTGTINVVSTLIYIPAALLLDMSVTAINNHMDKRETSEAPHYSRRTSLGLIWLMMTVSAVLGIYLVYLHGAVVFLAGAFAFFIGITYTFGPAPISKSAYGEVAAGFTVGTVIMFIVVSINSPNFQPIILTFNQSEMRLLMDIDIVRLVSFFIVTLPVALCIANILLANNICDSEADREYRYTLVHHIGRSNALSLFAALYYGAYVLIAAASILGLIPLWSLLTLVTFVPVRKNIQRFFENQSKSKTFSLSVKSFVLISSTYALSMVVGRFL